MANIHTYLNRYQLKYRRTSRLDKVVVSVALVLSCMTLVTLRVGQWEAEEKLEKLQQQAAALEQRNRELRQSIDELGTTDSIREIAREELGLVDPDTILFEEAD